MDAPLFQEYGPGWYVGEEVEKSVERADERIKRQGRAAFSGFSEPIAVRAEANILFIRQSISDIEALFRKSIRQKLTIHTNAARFIVEKLITDLAFCRKLNEQAETLFGELHTLPEMQEFLTSMLVLGSKKTGPAANADLVRGDPEMQMHAQDRRRFSDLPGNEQERRLGHYAERFLSLVPQSMLAFFFLKSTIGDEKAMGSFLEKEIMDNWKSFYREGFSSFLLFTTGNGYKIFISEDWAKTNLRPISGEDVQNRGPNDLVLRTYDFSDTNVNSIYSHSSTMYAFTPRNYVGPRIADHVSLRAKPSPSPATGHPRPKARPVH